ncbi:major capsid protein P2 [Aliamphritea ceti]|uniref:major capsid protein P2 n=1 Tax=Aliamphritea ceti TaxID=1524258 RepID=UPI0021C2F9FC|nr:major capsid protein P2 [Aliamphritea ceti]
MTRIREDIQIIENATAGQRCIVRPITGRTWLDWHIEHGGLTLAQITNIKVLLVSANRTLTLQEYKDGAELDEINKRYGRKTEAGTLSFYFRRPEMETEMERMAYALGTGGLSMVRVEFDIASGTTPVIKAWGKKTAERPVQLGYLTQVVAHNSGGNAEGDNHFDSIDLRDRIAAIHIKNDKVLKAELRVDDAIAFNLDRARADFDQEGAVVPRVPYAADKGFCLDFLQAGVTDETLVMRDDKKGYRVRQMRLTTTLGASANSTVRYVTEYITSWNDLVRPAAQFA